MTTPSSGAEPGGGRGAEPVRPQPPAQPPPHQITPSRLGGLWIAMTCGAVILLLLLIFILENSHSVDIAYFGVHGQVPLGVALLLAAVLGVLLVVVPGAGRMLQLRRAARRHREVDEALGVGGAGQQAVRPWPSRTGDATGGQQVNPAPRVEPIQDVDPDDPPR